MNTVQTLEKETIKGQVALKRISLKIKRLRKKSNYTQKYVAEQLSLGLRSYQRIENRECGYDLSLLYKLCEIFKANFLELTNPYAPKDVPKNIFCHHRSELEELCSYELVDFLEGLRINPEDVMATEAFTTSVHPLAFITPFKAEFNKKARHFHSRFDAALGLRNESTSEQFWDQVLFYQPKYSVVKHSSGDVLINRHFYTAYDEQMISALISPKNS